MVVVSAVVALGGLITGGRADDSARTVMFELVEIFLRSDLSENDGVREIRDSEGSVGSEGGMANGGRVLVRVGRGSACSRGRNVSCESSVCIADPDGMGDSVVRRESCGLYRREPEVKSDADVARVDGGVYDCSLPPSRRLCPSLLDVFELCV